MKHPPPPPPGILLRASSQLFKAQNLQTKQSLLSPHKLKTFFMNSTRGSGLWPSCVYGWISTYSVITNLIPKPLLPYTNFLWSSLGWVGGYGYLGEHCILFLLLTTQLRLDSLHVHLVCQHSDHMESNSTWQRPDRWTQFKINTLKHLTESLNDIITDKRSMMHFTQLSIRHQCSTCIKHKKPTNAMPFWHLVNIY